MLKNGRTSLTSFNILSANRFLSYPGRKVNTRVFRISVKSVIKKDSCILAKRICCHLT